MGKSQRSGFECQCYISAHFSMPVGCTQGNSVLLLAPHPTNKKKKRSGAIVAIASDCLTLSQRQRQQDALHGHT